MQNSVNSQAGIVSVLFHLVLIDGNLSALYAVEKRCKMPIAHSSCTCLQNSGGKTRAAACLFEGCVYLTTADTHTSLTAEKQLRADSVIDTFAEGEIRRNSHL